MLRVETLSKILPSFAIQDVSLDVPEGSYFVLLGATGAGKSLLLKAIAGLIDHDRGKVILDGQDITHYAIQNRQAALVFQESTLFPQMSVYDNLAYPLRCRKMKSRPIKERINAIASDFEIGHLLARDPRTLSGGETQCVSLARAVVSKPKCLLLDEPLSSLDVKSRPRMRALLRKINQQGLTVLHVTHDYTEAVSLASHVAVLEKGRIEQTGSALEIFHRPKTEFIAHFVGIKNFFKGYLQKAQGDDGDLRRFVTNGLVFSVLSSCSEGPGHILIRSEDILISEKRFDSSARNNFQGVVTEIVSAVTGMELVVALSGMAEGCQEMELSALISPKSVKELDLCLGKKVFISFKASAVEYIQS